MNSLWSSTNRWLTWFHRWAGVFLCVLFAMWFATGAVLHFVGFPALTSADQAANAEPIELALVHLPAATAFSAYPSIDDWRLVSVAGRPVYVGTPSSGVAFAIAADSGERLPLISESVAREVAQRFAGVRAQAISVSGPLDYDQWIVHQHFDALRPLYRVRLDDRERTDLYVSARTGEVVQRTRGAERGWNWCGAVTHWIYFTALRKSWTAWNQVVWWVALVGVAASAVGTWLGILRYARNRSAGRRGVSPFRGWLRWHHIIGLFASVFVVSWILSGWLSMDHGRLFSHPDPSTAEVSALRGLDMASIGRFSTPEELARLGPASVVKFSAIAGHPVLTAEGPKSQAIRVLWLGSDGSTLGDHLPDDFLTDGLARAWTATIRPVSIDDSYDRLYRLAESASRDAAGFLIGGQSGIRVYLNRYTGQITAVMDPSRRRYAWIYYAFHTFQFPWLIDHSLLRTVLVLLLLTLGLVFSITGVVIGYVRLRRQFT